LIVQRWLFETMRPEQLTPSYWINMGAAAITTLAGVRLLSIAGTNPLTAGIARLIEASTVLFWALATWWVPLLVTLLIWRHMVHRIRPSLRLEYWSMVFPLGMYTVSKIVARSSFRADLRRKARARNTFSRAVGQTGCCPGCGGRCAWRLKTKAFTYEWQGPVLLNALGGFAGWCHKP